MPRRRRTRASRRRQRRRASSSGQRCESGRAPSRACCVTREHSTRAPRACARTRSTRALTCAYAHAGRRRARPRRAQRARRHASPRAHARTRVYVRQFAPGTDCRRVCFLRVGVARAPMRPCMRAGAPARAHTTRRPWQALAPAGRASAAAAATCSPQLDLSGKRRAFQLMSCPFAKSRSAWDNVVPLR
jgi:hypothetical protein